jgi:hypothetical protein
MSVIFWTFIGLGMAAALLANRQMADGKQPIANFKLPTSEEWRRHLISAFSAL